VVVADAVTAEGWRIARTLSTQNVSVETYAAESPGRPRFEQAVSDGLAIQFHRRQREVILAANFDGAADIFSTVEAHESILRGLRTKGAVSLYSQRDSQWANGISPDGDEFFPIWTDENAPRAWQHGWPGYEVTRLTPDTGLDELLTEINAADMWVAIQVGPSALMTTHPIGLRELLNRPGISGTRAGFG
jgi:hypothetical protein